MFALAWPTCADEECKLLKAWRKSVSSEWSALVRAKWSAIILLEQLSYRASGALVLLQAIPCAAVRLMIEGERARTYVVVFARGGQGSGGGEPCAPPSCVIQLGGLSDSFGSHDLAELLGQVGSLPQTVECSSSMSAVSSGVLIRTSCGSLYGRTIGGVAGAKPGGAEGGEGVGGEGGGGAGGGGEGGGGAGGGDGGGNG